MSVRVPNYHWHKRFHARDMANPAYQARSFEERGVLDTIRNLAAQTNNSGSIRIGLGAPLTVKTLAEHLSSVVPGADVRVLRKQIATLVTARLLDVTASGVVRPAMWRGDQAVSDETARKRAYRERRSAAREADPCDEEPRAGSSPPPPPPQASGSGSGRASGSGRDSPVSEDGTVPPQKDRESEPERDARASLNQAPESGSAQDGGGGGGEERIWIDDPIIVALRICNERGLFYENSWKKKLTMLTQYFKGDRDRAVATFRDCMQTMLGMAREKKVRTTRAQTLHGLINKRLEGQGP